MYKDHLDVNPEVVKALEEGRPVVALESTIIAHGMPYPKNVETALAVEEVIRANGAVPATIGILSGRIKIGLTKEEIEYMAHAENVLKVSRRDLPLAISKKMDGATTVAGTMIAAHMAGIKLFVTGGIGGVHRGAGESFDISADLEELKMTDVTVVCAGAKAILDIPATMEYLETAGVPVIAYGTDEIPAFYSRKSGVSAICRLDSPEEIGALISMKEELGPVSYTHLCMTGSRDVAEEFKRVCEFSSRASWSNCPRAPQVILTKIYEDPNLLKRVMDERKLYRDMLIRRGKAFREEAERIGLVTLPFRSGFFMSIPCADPDAVAAKLEEEAIYLSLIHI